jgi:hypothetical protein
MTRFYVQKEAGTSETVGALAIALGVGGVSFYLARMFLAREDVEYKPPPRAAREPGVTSRLGAGARQ